MMLHQVILEALMSCLSVLLPPPASPTATAKSDAILPWLPVDESDCPSLHYRFDQFTRATSTQLNCT